MKKRKLFEILPFKQYSYRSILCLIYLKAVMFHLIIVSTTFSSCGVSEERKSELKELERKQLFTSISKQFDALIFPDTVYSPTTLYFQNAIRKGNKHIINDFFFDDVERKDSGYLVSIHSGFIYPKYFELECNESVVKKFFPEFPEVTSAYRYSNDNTFLIVKLFSVSKIKFSVDADYEKSEEDKEITAYVEMNTSNSFIFKGELIDLYLSK